MITMVPTTVDNLDAAAMSTVFAHMQPSDLASSASVSRDWASLASDDRLWAAAYGSLGSEAWRASTQHQSAALRSGWPDALPLHESASPSQHTHAAMVIRQLRISFFASGGHQASLLVESIWSPLVM